MGSMDWYPEVKLVTRVGIWVGHIYQYQNFMLRSRRSILEYIILIKLVNQVVNRLFPNRPWSMVFLMSVIGVLLGFPPFLTNNLVCCHSFR